MAMDLELALRAMDDDRKLLEQLATIFSEDAPAISMEFQKAVATHDSKSARMAIHSLKGLAASFYDKQAVESFSSIEQSCAEEKWNALDETPSLVHSKIEALIADMQHFELLSRSEK